MKRILWAVLIASVTILPIRQAKTIDTTQFWMKIRATDKFQRSVIANTGAAIEITSDDYVIAFGNVQEKERIEKLGWMIAATPLVNALDFPPSDGEYHNYTELKEAMVKIAADYPDIVKLISIGKTTEGRDILGLHISGDLANSATKPGIIFMGGHHAREHLSVETPLRLTQKLLELYKSGDAKAMALLDNRDLHIIPAVNPDGLEFDISTGKYQYWRKNRRLNADGVYGVDLNRNYGFGWGTGGSSTDTSSDVYMGPKPFSEPETQAIKAYVESNKNISILLSFHTFSKLILYPWGHTYDPIADGRAKQVHEIMAKKMAQWNGYTPEQSSALYIASGDTTDWSFGELKIISFTFELDPGNTGGSAGFYPGAKIIQQVVDKNWNPFIYLIERADNPYRVIDEGGIGPGASIDGF